MLLLGDILVILDNRGFLIYSMVCLVSHFNFSFVVNFNTIDTYLWLLFPFDSFDFIRANDCRSTGTFVD